MRIKPTKDIAMKFRAGRLSILANGIIYNLVDEIMDTKRIEAKVIETGRIKMYQISCNAVLDEAKLLNIYNPWHVVIEALFKAEGKE